MEENVFFTKGDKEEILSRVSQVHTITLYCPIRDLCMISLRGSFETMLPKYKKSENRWEDVPAIDVLNAFVFTTSVLDSTLLNFNRDILSVIISSLKMFKKLKKINFDFTEDEDIASTYDKILKKENFGASKCLY